MQGNGEKKLLHCRVVLSLRKSNFCKGFEKQINSELSGIGTVYGEGNEERRDLFCGDTGEDRRNRKHPGEWDRQAVYVDVKLTREEKK